jgi:hypothetical protein
MKYFIPGLIIGALMNVFLFGPAGGIEVYPEWTGSLKAMEKIEPSRDPGIGKKTVLAVKEDGGYTMMGGNGEVLHSTRINGFFAASGNGRYYIEYQKVGTSVDFYSFKGDGFWKLKSMEYPYLSYNGRLVMLLNGDHSRIRLVDYNGNEIGARIIYGRLCTVISFSDGSDIGAAGFLDGTYYFVDHKGAVINTGRAPSGNAVKGVAVSDRGLYAAVHYGDEASDSVRIIDAVSGKYSEARLKSVHPVKTSMCVTDDGMTAFMDLDTITGFSPSGGAVFEIRIPPKRYGFSTIRRYGNVYSATYTKTNGEARFCLFRKDGTVIIERDYPTESFMESSFRDGLVFLRGSDSLYCYRIHQPASQ